MQVRVARPTRDLGRALAFYRDAVGLEVIASFEGHDGYSGAILGVPDEAVQLELVFHEAVAPSPTEEDQLVLYLGSPQEVADRVAGLSAAGYDPQRPSNPYWEREGASAFVDSDGYWLIPLAGQLAGTKCLGPVRTTPAGPVVRDVGPSPGPVFRNDP
jgi:catechol 2,3-dioxygenase-like lactoylglutathione lyase family enzyme